MKFLRESAFSLGLVMLGAGSVFGADRVSVKTLQTHRGWTDAVVLGNGQVEAVMVPSIGRVMQFRFAGETEGPFWENPKLAGKPMPEKPWDTAHGSFGGDKTWPAPQSLWNWPPPDVFDTAPLAFRIEADHSVVLTSPVSKRFGIRTERRLTLAADAPRLRIITTYEKVSGPPVETSVWTITQAKDPVAVFVPVPTDTRFPAGTTQEWGVPTNHYSMKDGLARVMRDPKGSHKVGNDALSIVWIGEKVALCIDVTRQSGATYPDGGCSAEVYTNADPVPYVELELLGPLHTLKVGDRISATNTYTLFRRDRSEASVQARKILAR